MFYIICREDIARLMTLQRGRLGQVALRWSARRPDPIRASASTECVHAPSDHSPPITATAFSIYSRTPKENYGSSLPHPSEESQTGQHFAVLAAKEYSPCGSLYLRPLDLRFHFCILVFIHNLRAQSLPLGWYCEMARISRY